jgi:hypothetical protein
VLGAERFLTYVLIFLMCVLTFMFRSAIISMPEWTRGPFREKETEMDLSTYFLIEHNEDYVVTRLNSARAYSYGTGSLPVAMIARVAAAVRRAATAIEQWAHGRDDASTVPARRLPSL